MSKKKDLPIRKAVFVACEATLIASTHTIKINRLQLVRDYVSQFNRKHGTTVSVKKTATGIVLNRYGPNVKGKIQRLLAAELKDFEGKPVTPELIEDLTNTVRRVLTRLVEPQIDIIP